MKIYNNKSRNLYVKIVSCNIFNVFDTSKIMSTLFFENCLSYNLLYTKRLIMNKPSIK